MGLQHTLFDTKLAQRDTHRKRIDEQPKDPSRPLPALHPSKQYRAKDRILLTRTAADDQSPGNMANTRRTDVQGSRLGTQSLGEVVSQPQPGLTNTRTIPLHIQKTKRRRRLVHIPKHLPEKAFMLFPADPQLGLGNKIAERQRLCQARALTSHMRTNFGLDHL